MQTDGKIVVGGNTTKTSGTGNDFAMIRLSFDCTPATFGIPARRRYLLTSGKP